MAPPTPSAPPGLWSREALGGATNLEEITYLLNLDTLPIRALGLQPLQLGNNGAQPTPAEQPGEHLQRETPATQGRPPPRFRGAHTFSVPSNTAVGTQQWEPYRGISRPCLVEADRSGPLPAAQPLASSAEPPLLFFRDAVE